MREARRYTRSEMDAQDIAQSALLQAWRFRDRCRDPGNPLPWMLGITRREAWRLTARTGPAEVPMDECSSREPAAPDFSEALVGRLDLQSALSRLDAPEQELLELRYGEDLTQPVIANRLGIPEGTAKVRLYRVRSHLRELMTS